MEIDSKKLRELLEYLLGTAEKIEAELLAYKSAFMLLTAFEIYPGLDELLSKARETCAPMVAKKHEEGRKKVFQLLERADEDQEIREFLARYKPQGPVN